MLNRFWNYQKILAISADFDSKSKVHALKFFFTYMSVFFLSAILGYGTMTFLPVMLGLVMIRYIVKSESKLCEILPVSQIYTIVNIYLFMILTIVFAYLMFLSIFSILGLIANIHPILDFGGLETGLSFIYGWKVILVLFLICIIIMSIFIPMFFIKKRIIRWILYFIGYFGMYISLIVYKDTFPVTLDSDQINLMKTAKAMTNFNEILFDLLPMVVIGLPVSILISYRLYSGKRC